MIDRGIRQLAIAIVRAAVLILPATQRPWGQAMQYEIEAIEDAGEAISFATSCLGFTLGQAISVYLLKPLLTPFVVTADHGAIFMRDHFYLRPRRLTILSAVAATGLGIAYMSVAGAPVRYLMMNFGALVLGLTIAGLLTLSTRQGKETTDGLAPALGPILLLTSLFGIAADGAARWVTIGGLAVQLSLVLLPVLAISFVRTRDILSTIGVVAAALALAIQPDRAMSGALFAAMLTLAIRRPERNVIVALAAAAAGFAITLLRADTLGAMPYVDQILYSSFGVHPLAGMAVLAGVCIMLVPAIVGCRYDSSNRERYLVFGAMWFGIIAAAALGNYPTPVVGYGGSAIIGYVLSLLGLPKHMHMTRPAHVDSGKTGSDMPDQSRMRIGLSLAR